MALAVGGCGGAAHNAATVTVEKQVTVTQARAASQHHRRRSTAARSKSKAKTFVACDSNIQAKAATTTCPFAENVFWAYWTSGESSSALQVWSPAAHANFATTCDSDGAQVVCTTSDEAAIKFSQSAVDGYSQSQADAYADSHDLGPDPSGGVPDTDSAPDGGGGGGDCQGYDPCIPPGADVDCAGGSGDGPRYVEGPVEVTGSDPYDLDRDGDGVGCDQ
jgi:hypothetical protein